MPKVNIRYLSKGAAGVEKCVQTVVKPQDFVLITRGVFESVVADESVLVKAGEIKPVKIKPINLTREEITIPCHISRHALGCVISIGGRGRPRRVEEKREFNFAVFAAVRDGSIRRDDLIGVVNVFSTATHMSALAKLLLQVRTHIARPSRVPR